MKRLFSALAISVILSGCNSDDKTSKNIEYQVGMQRFTLSYDSELAVTNPDFARAINVYDSPERKLMVKIWYPAEVDTTTQTPIHYGFHTPDVPLTFDARFLSWPDYYQTFIDDYEKYQRPSLTYFDASPIQQRFPVVLHSHGLGSVIEDDQRYYEALVKQGYIVAAIGHTYESALVTVDDNSHISIPDTLDQRFYFPKPEIDPNLLMTDEERIALSKIPLDEIAPLELVEKYQTTNSHVLSVMNELKNLRRDDMQGTYQQLQELNQGDIPSNLTGLMDLNSVVATGYSYGGVASRLFCEAEDACVATVNHDGNSFLTKDEVITKPHLAFLNSYQGEYYPDLSDEENEHWITFYSTYAALETHSLIETSDSELDVIQLKDSTHQTFSGFWIPDWDKPTRDKESAQLTVFNKIVHYLDHHLKADKHRNFCQSSDDKARLTLLYSNTCH